MRTHGYVAGQVGRPNGRMRRLLKREVGQPVVDKVNAVFAQPKAVVRLNQLFRATNLGAIAMLSKEFTKQQELWIQFAATNLVLELGVLLWVLMAWQFAAAEFVGGTVMLVLIGVGYGLLLPKKLAAEAVEHAKSDVRSSMEGHAEMAMGECSGSWLERLNSRKGWVAISHYYVMNWSMVWKDI